MQMQAIMVFVCDDVSDMSGCWAVNADGNGYGILITYDL